MKFGAGLFLDTPLHSGHCGYIAIVGRPNVGKSTLLNVLVGEKIAAASRKPQTTRHSILGIVTQQQNQLIFVDTPGIDPHNQRHIGRVLNRTAAASLADVDVVLLMVEAGKFEAADEAILDMAIDSAKPIVLTINKIDRLHTRAELLPYIDQVQKMHQFAHIIPISGLKALNTDALLATLTTLLPTGVALFEEDTITDRSERFRVCEVIREQLLERLGQEIPYATYVEVESWQDQGEQATLHIGATIFVARKSQKGIVVGKGGHMIKAIGTGARQNLEAILGRKVMLQLRVAVHEGWQDKFESMQVQ